MRAYRMKKKVTHQGKIQLEALPFADGEVVEVIVFTSPEQDIQNGEKTFLLLDSLKGSVLEYLDPTEPVAEE